MDEREIVFNRAKNAMLSRDFALAARLFKSLLADDPNNLELLNSLGQLYIKSSDDEKAVVGTINLDFRSLYLHFECATFFYKTNTVKYVENDFQNT